MLVKELLEHLEGWHPEDEVTFGGQAFKRVKRRGQRLVDIELDPMPIYDAKTGQWSVVPDGPPVAADAAGEDHHD